MVTRMRIFAALLGVLSLPLSGACARAAVVPSEEADQVLVIKDLTVGDGSVSGTVVNKSAATLRGIQVLLTQSWLWNDERHPGSDSPGRTLPFMLETEVAPHSSAPFTLQIPPLAPRADGRFATTIEVLSFTAVGP